MATINDLLTLAQNEVGYLEKKTADLKYLYDKKANAGYNNYTKYAKELDDLKDFYNGRKNGYSWCDVFVDWCFVKTFGRARAQQLINQPDKSTGAGVGFSKKFYQNKNRYFSAPEVGDQIFFKNASGGMQHTGLVYKTDKNYVYTIEGNTSGSSNVIANGGAVCAKKYSLKNKYIDGYGRPDYSANERGNAAAADKVLYTRYVSGVDYEGLVIHDIPGGPDTNNLLQVGTKVNVYQTSGQWSRIGVNQWVYSAYLKILKPKVKYVQAKDGLNVRKSYTTNSARLTTLPYGTPVQVFKTKNGWSKVSPDANAWVASNWIK